MMEYNIRIRRSDGIYFSYESEDLRVLSLEGADFPQIEVFKEPRGQGHGDIITGKRKLSREISIEVLASSWLSYNRNRQRVIAFHNANYTYDIEITYMGVTKIAKDCEISFVQYPTERFMNNPKLTVKYLSPHSDLFSDMTDITSFTTNTPLWHCTRVYEGSSGSLAFGEIEKTKEKIINYEGSEPTPIKIIVNATGYVNGIDISIDDFKSSIKSILNEGDTLVIDSHDKTVRKNGVYEPLNLYKIEELSELKVKFGDNKIKVESGDNIAFLAEIYFTGRYGGI